MTARSLGLFYRTDGDTLERAYKHHLSGFSEWTEKEHADKYLIFPENLGPHMCLDETSTKDGELFTILSNKDGHCRKGSIAAIVRGTRLSDVTDALMRIPEESRKVVADITMDFASTMASIASAAFPWADHILDRFHMQKMAIDGVNNLRMKHKREAMSIEAEERKELRRKEMERIKHWQKHSPGWCKTHKMVPKNYHAKELENGDTLPELLERSSYLLRMSSEKWTPKQKERAKLLFELYPDIKEAYGLSHGLRVIFNNKRATKASAKVSLSEWYEKVAAFKNSDFCSLAKTLESREDEVLNYFLYRRTNASAESLNTKIKAFRAQLRGIIDLKFFLFRLTNIYA